MLSNERIVCVSSIDWDFSWQGHQQIMSTLAAQGARVLFVENTGVRGATWQDLPRLRQRFRRFRWRTAGLRQEAPRLWVYSPLALPFPYSPLARRVNRLAVGGVIRRWLRATPGAGQPVLWTFLPTPLVEDLRRDLAPVLTVYYCIDDLPASSARAAPAAVGERELLRTADLVFVTAERLRQRALRHRAQVELAPFGVVWERFARARDDPAPAPADLAGLGRPIVGYVGGINPKLDQPLLAAVARQLPEATFVLVGPVESPATALAACPNVRLLGTRPHRDLPRYVREFAVGIIPYRLTEYTAHVYPAKLNEYLATGVPVVSTPLPEILRFNAEHGELVGVAGDAPAFAAAIRQAAGDASPAAVERRRHAARANDWAARIEALAGLVEHGIAARRGLAAAAERGPRGRAAAG